MATDDYYALLGVDEQATSEEIKKAYRRVARQLHPDVNKEPDAEDRFKEATKAYETLSDTDLRARYDRYGPEGVEGRVTGDPFQGGLSDILNDLFGGGGPFGGGGGARRPSGPPRGVDLETTLELDFEDAVFGVEKPVDVRTAVACEVCEATGASPGTSAQECSECHGLGQVQRVRQSILGQLATASPCPRCSGMGQIISSPCEPCSGEGRVIVSTSYPVDVPPGVDSGTTLRLTGRGAVGPRGGGTGDLYVHIKTRPHAHLQRDGANLIHRLTIPITQAALGAGLEYETLDGVEELEIPRGTQNDQIFTLRGRGVPHVRGRGRGDLIVVVRVETPTDLSKDEERLLRELAQVRGDEVAEEGGLRKRFRSAFR